MSKQMIIKDENGNVIKYIDKCGNVEHYLYDSLNRVICRTNSFGEVENVYYDSEGNVSYTNELFK